MSEPCTKPVSCTTTDHSAVNEASNEVESLKPPGTVSGQDEANVTQARYRTAETRHLLANYQQRWSTNELAILAELKEKCNDLTRRAMYIEYQNECRRSGIPDRSFEAFKKKV